MPEESGASWLPSDSSGRLPCGMPVEDLLAQVADGAPPADPVHQRGCLHCRATLIQLEDLWSPVRQVTAETVQAPPELLQAVMAQVRELSRNSWSAVLLDPSGRTRIAARVVGAVARLAAESVPHVTLALGGGRAATPAGAVAERAGMSGQRGGSATDVGVSGSHVVVDVQIAVDYGASMHRVADQVRERIAHHIAVQTGLTALEVNVAVVDVRVPARRP